MVPSAHVREKALFCLDMFSPALFPQSRRGRIERIGTISALW